MKTILVVGATGSIGRYVVKEALKQGYNVRALVRQPQKARFDKSVELFVADLTNPVSLQGVTDNIDGIIFTQGNYADPERVDYGGVLNIIKLLEHPTKLVLMSTIYSILTSQKNIHFDNGCAWKRRTERVVRASGMPYTIVRPSWFDCNKADEQKLYLTQGRKDYTLTANDGGVSRKQLAETLVHALMTVEAEHKTVELFSQKGSKTTDFQALFATAKVDQVTNIDFDAIYDPNNRPLSQEPATVVRTLQALSGKLV